jgi:quercetin dioxygenase-like cupin family protein
MLRRNEALLRPQDKSKEATKMTETITKPYRLAAGEGLADVWWKSGRVTVKAGGPEAGHAISQIEVDDPQGTGPPLHVHHNEDETFYVLAGQVTFVVGEQRIDATAGDFVFGPRDIPHAYVVRSERARMLVTASPGGIEQVFVSLGVPVTGSEPPADAVLPMDEAMRLFADHGAEIVGPPLSLGDLP